MIEVDTTDISENGYTINTKTRNHSKVRYFTIAVLVSTDNSFIMDRSGIDENSLSYFDINEVREGIGK